VSTRLKRIICLIATVALLFTAGLTIQPLQQMRTDYDLTNEPVKGLSPQLALATQVLGWGRGLIIDVIWIRMETLKMQDRFFELVQLADWACKLAPRFPQVWDIQSWNLAYNVGCRVSHLPDRWPWVWSAVELLRDEGIPQNPHSPMLYDRLAWLFFHKMGEQMDNANMFYKMNLGLMMHEILGNDGDKETLEALIAAPRTREELLLDEGVKHLYDECSAYGFDIVEGFFEFYKRTPSVPPAVREIVRRDYNQEAMKAVAAFARARRLRAELKMDPALMLDLRGTYGPFDWRSPYPHAIYWATIGLQTLDELEARTIQKFEAFGKEVPKPYTPKEEKYRGGETLYEFERVTLKRIIYFSLQSLVRHGRVLFDSKGRMLLEVGPDYRFADAALPFYREIMETHGERFAGGAQQGFTNFLMRGILEFYYMGDVTKSQEYFALLKKEFPEVVGNLTYDGYRRREMQTALADMTTAEARRITSNYILRALYAIGCGAYDKAAALEREARDFAKEWNADSDSNLRSTIRFDKLRETAIVDVLTGTARFPKEVRLRLLAEMREKNDDVVDRILKNLEASGVTLPTPEEVDEELQQAEY